MKLSRFSTFVFLLFLAVYTFGQVTPTGYNPFVPENLDDTTKLAVTPVVESSYHRYWMYGDPNYTDTSTYVWYVENGTFVEYDSLTNLWDTLTVKKIGHGKYIEIKGEMVDSIRNASQIWVRWNTGIPVDSAGYVAAYEISSSGCILEDSITGFKHEMFPQPAVWFYPGNIEQCSEFEYNVTVSFNNISDFSFPYKLSYSYPGNDGIYLTGELLINSIDEIDASLSYTFRLPGVQDINVIIDEQYLVTLMGLSDKFNSTGIIAPLGPPRQYAQLTLTIYHLPQTGGMTMD